MNRAQLKLSIHAWLHRASLRTPVSTDFHAADGFIALAEQDMNERLRARCMIIRTTQEITGQYDTLPCDYLEMHDCRIAGGGPPLYYVSRDGTANALWAQTMARPPGEANYNISQGGTAAAYFPIVNPPAYPWGDGTPRAFTVIGLEIEWSPFPIPPIADPNNPIALPPFEYPSAEMAYFQRLSLGMDDTDTNQVLSLYPACYLYGALVHSAPFLRDDQRMMVWTQRYDQAIAGANAEAERAKSQGSRLRQTYKRLA